MKWTYGTRGDTRMIKVHALSARDRFLVPTEQQIKDMMRSLEENGQLSPVLVTPVTHNTYRIVFGATRYMAASRLHWDKLNCTIVHGSARDCRILELTENADRKNLTALQRKALRAERRRLIADHVKETAPSKGGRGKKGGTRQAARDLGVSKSTAHRATHESKPSQNASSGTVSEPPAAPTSNAPPPAPQPEASDAHVPPSMRGTGLTKLAITWTPMEDALFEEYRAADGGGLDRSHAARDIINDFLKAWKRKRGPNLQVVS